MTTLLFLLGESSTTAYDVITSFWAQISGWIAFFIALGPAYLYLRQKGEEQIHATDLKAKASIQGLLDIREKELVEKECELKEQTKLADEYKNELDAVTVDYRALSGIKIDELMKFHTKREEFEALWELDKVEIRRLGRINDMLIYNKEKG